MEKLGQPVPLHLSVRTKRDLVDEHEVLGNHVIRQMHHAISPQSRENLFRGLVDLRAQHQVRAERVVVHRQGRRRHAPMLRQHALDLPQLDAEPVHLHLRVLATQDLDLASRTDAAQVTRAEQRLARGRVPHELVRRALGILVVPVRHARATDKDRPRHPRLAVLHALVQHVHALVAHRTPIRNARPAFRNTAVPGTVRRQLEHVAPDRRLRRTAHADYANVLAIAHRANARRKSHRDPVAAHVDHAQGARQSQTKVLHVTHQQLHERRNRVPHRHLLRNHQLKPLRRIRRTHRARVRHHHRPTTAQHAEDVVHRQVEAQARQSQHAILRADEKQTVQVLDRVHCSAVVAAHSLRHARRP
mmetsp:Transcript_17038/g.38316  ORF Transcript_17038/g.38316 Transcript_17038/m.38316 type:complete len:360 (+) Transcript_17038:3365-4444(+)